MAAKSKIVSPQEGFQELFVRSNVDVVFGGGVLNPQPLYSLVAVPGGFVRMGDLNVGDIVCNPMGGTQRVNAIIDKPIQPCVEFVLEDERKVQSALSHHWMIENEDGEVLDITTSDIVSRLDDGQNLYIPHTKPVNNHFRYLSNFVNGMADVDESTSEMYMTLAYASGYGCKKERISKKMCRLTVNFSRRSRIIGYNILPPTEMRCINVSGKEHIYLTDNYVITRNCGKAQPLDSHVLTPNGFVRMGDLKVGDIVSGSDGGTQKVLHIFERGELDTYRITFDDGTQVECCPEHLWTVWDNNNAQYETIEAQYINKDKDRYRLGLHKALSLSYSFIMSLSEADMIRSNGYKVTSDNNGHAVSISVDWKRFSSIESIGRKQMRCIVVSNEDHLYITDGFNLTHNSFGAILSVAEPSLDPNFRACFTRRTLGELKTGGGLVDDFPVAYGDYVEIKKSDNPRVNFPSGAFVEMRQIADENLSKVKEQWKGSQYDLIYMDELTSYQFSTFTYLLTRNRGKGKWTGKFRGTTNPEKDCWVRTFIDWYILPTGEIDPERNGVVRYFYINGSTVNDVVWGDSKEEVYYKCRDSIDRKLIKFGKSFTYENFIKSFTFYLGNMAENKASIGNNLDYVGSVAAAGGALADQLVEGNWNVSSKDDSDNPIPSHLANSILTNDEMRNGDRWITSDLADIGKDNMTIIVWDGFHILEIETHPRSMPRQNADYLHRKAVQYDIADNHIIFDGTRAAYILDYIPTAMPFISANTSKGLYKRDAHNIKTECYLRVVEAVKNRMISMADSVISAQYKHVKLKNFKSIGEEFVDECCAVRFRYMPSGKKNLFTKKEMNALLGNGRSMDILDPIAMRFLPVLEYAYGEELEMSSASYEPERAENSNFNVFDESNWC